MAEYKTNDKEQDCSPNASQKTAYQGNQQGDERVSGGGEEVVVLFHGLGRTRFAMRPVERHLTRQGYTVVNVGYPSQRYAISDLVQDYVRPAIERAAKQGPVNVVTHSLGGILLRYYLAQFSQEHARGLVKRVVMLAPPNHGSEVVDQLRRIWGIPRILGPAFEQLGTDNRSIPLQLLEKDVITESCDVGIVAGTVSYEPWLSQWLTKENDGKVAVQSAVLAGADFLTVPANHTTIMRDKRVLREISFFLAKGRFTSQQ